MSDSFSTARIVATREVNQRIRARSFIVLTVLLCVGVLAVGVISRLTGSDGPSRYKVAVVGGASTDLAAVVSQVSEAAGIEITLGTTPSRADGEATVRDETVDALIDPTAGEVITNSGLDATLAATLDSAWRVTQASAAATAAGLSPDELGAVLNPPSLKPTELKKAKSSTSTGQAIGMITSVLLFLSITTFGGLVLTGVVEEKVTGVIEVLLSQVSPRHLLMGKVFGNTVVAMVQLGAAVVAGLIALSIAKVTVPTAVWVGLPLALVWFIGGFLLYCTLFALAGSMVSRLEDAQGATMPVTMVLLVAYMAVFTVGQVPDSTAARVLSVLPPFAPLMMPLRIVTGSASVLEIVLAAVLLMAAIYGMLRLVSAVYMRTLLHRGSRLTWRQAIALRG